MEAGHGGGGKLGGVRVFPELASGLHAGEPFAEVRFPAFKAVSDRCPGAEPLAGALADFDRSATVISESPDEASNQAILKGA